MASEPLARMGRNEEASSAEDRRRETRHPAWASAHIANSAGQSQGVALADVSEHGCAIKGDAGWLRTGGFVSIRIGEQPSLQGIIRWIRDGAAGMEFLRPIPPERIEWHDLMDVSLG